MVDWSEVLDESDRSPGASEAEITEFVSTVGLPLSEAEVAMIYRGQQNPFPASDPLYAAYVPFDPRMWTIPNRPLPPAYLDFLRWSNGGEFQNGERCFQFFSTREVRELLLSYNLPQYMPGALPFALNGGGRFYLFDMRRAAVDGEYPIICSHAGNLGWGPDECVRIARSFEEACRGTTDVDNLR